jgi:hypothetical protein
MRTATINNILLPPRFLESFFSTRLGWRLLNCTAHKRPRTIIVISDTNEGGIRTSTYSLATSDVPKKCFGLPTFLGENAKLTSVVIGNDLFKDLVFIHKKVSILNDKRIYLNHTSLSILYYNTIEQGSKTLQSESETT